MTGPSTDDPRSAEAVFEPVDAALTDPLPVAPGATVADIGPGAGTLTLRLAERVGPSGRVYAVDVDTSALAAGHGVYLAPVKTATSARVVELPDTVAAVLARQLEQYPAAAVKLEDATDRRNPRTRTAELLFTKDGAVPMTRRDWSALWRPAVKQADGVPEGFGLHGLRHYFATLLIHAGASVKTVQLALGHSSPTITLNTCTHEWPDALDRTRTLVDAALGEAPRPAADAAQ